MCERRTFRVIICLNNFFNDHRSVCRIFIREDMKYISDLEAHLGNMFKINNFYFVSNNQYLPSTEDIRIIQPEELLMVIPNCRSSKCPNVVTSTPYAQEVSNVEFNNRNTVSSDLENELINKIRKRKSKGSTEQNGESNLNKKRKKANKSESNINEIETENNFDVTTNKEMRKKKKVKTTKLTCEVDNVNILANDTFEEIPKKRKKERRESLNMTVTGSVYDEVEVRQKKRKCKKNSNDIDVETIGENLKIVKSGVKQNFEMCSGNDLPELARKCPPDIVEVKSNKDVSSELHSHSDNSFINSYTNKKKKKYPKKATYHTEGNKFDPHVREEEAGKELSKISEDNKKFQQEKIQINNPNRNVIVTRPKIDMCFDLPKQTNIVKSLVVYDLTGKLSDTSKADTLNNTSKTFKWKDGTRSSLIYDGKDVVSLNNSTNLQNSPIPAILKHVNNTEVDASQLDSNKSNVTAKPLMQLKKNEDEEVDISINDTAKEILQGSVILQNDKLVGAELVVKSDNLVENSKNVNPSDVNNGQKSMVEDISVFNSTTPSIKVTDNTENSLNSPLVSEDSLYKKHINSLSVQSKGEILSVPSMLNINSLSRSDISFDSQSVTSINLDSVSESDHFPTEFVTRRRRTRHRKRKSNRNSVHESSPLTINSGFHYKPPVTRAAPTMHIKFKDSQLNTDTFDELNECKESRKPIEISKDKECAANKESYEVNDETKTSHETPSHHGPVSNPLSNKTFSCDNGEAEVPEKTILQSPVMDKILPKLDDLIAFKIFRLSKDYNPELSSYVIGKVLSFNELTQDISLNLISGIDQFDEPEGKFSMDNETKDKSQNVQHFSWGSLIEPRLLFP